MSLLFYIFLHCFFLFVVKSSIIIVNIEHLRVLPLVPTDRTVNLFLLLFRMDVREGRLRNLFP